MLVWLLLAATQWRWLRTSFWRTGLEVRKFEQEAEEQPKLSHHNSLSQTLLALGSEW